MAFVGPIGVSIFLPAEKIATDGRLRCMSPARYYSRQRHTGVAGATGTRRSIRMKAVWKDAVIAESDATVMVEGNYYFPEASVNRQFISFSNHKTSCSWKGQASYY